MNEEEEHVDWYQGFYKRRDPEDLVRVLYNSRSYDSCEEKEIPAPLVCLSWDAYRDEFWNARLSTETSDDIWGL